MRVATIVFVTLLVGCSSSSSGGAAAGDATSSNDSGAAIDATDASADTQSIADAPADASTSSSDVAVDAIVDTGTPPPACGDAGCATGVWTSVTPPSIDASHDYGPASVQVDPARPQDLYVLFPEKGLWKSSDYGATWSGPINTGANGAALNTCQGYVKVAPEKASAAIIYVSCIQGDAVGFWRSTDGGVDWAHPNVLPNGGVATASNQSVYPPSVDPYDAKHLLIAGHGFDQLAESIDGGDTWTPVKLDPEMAGGSTFGINFVDTGDPKTTRTTFLCLAAGAPGTWRTTDGSATWTKVQTNQHPAGVSSIFQPGAPGVVYMAGVYSSEGDGVFRSDDYGVTWKHLGPNVPERVIAGTSRHLYAMYGWACGPGCDVPPNFEIGDVDGANWTTPPRPTGMSQGPAEIVVTSDGTHNILVTANYNGGLWRYVEPDL